MSAASIKAQTMALEAWLAPAPSRAAPQHRQPAQLFVKPRQVRDEIAHRLVHAALLARGRTSELSEHDVQLLRRCSLEAEVNDRALTEDEQAELQQLPKCNELFLRVESARWHSGQRSAAEREAYRDLNVAAKRREQRAKQQRLHERARELAAAEHSKAIEAWQQQEARREAVAPIQHKLCAADAASIMAAKADEELSLAAAGAERKLARGHALTEGELETLRVKVLSDRARRSKRPPSEAVEQRLRAWRGLGERDLARRLYESRATPKGGASSRRPPTAADLERATQRWLLVLSRDMQCYHPPPSGIQSVQVRSLAAAVQSHRRPAPPRPASARG